MCIAESYLFILADTARAVQHTLIYRLNNSPLLRNINGKVAYVNTYVYIYIYLSICIYEIYIIYIHRYM